MTDSVRPMLRIAQVEQRLGVDRRTIYRWANAGTFPTPIPLGDRSSAFYEDEVAAWQKAKEDAARRPLVAAES